MTKKVPPKTAKLTYNPPNGAPRAVKFIKEVETRANGVWWEVQDKETKEVLRARPGAIDW